MKRFKFKSAYELIVDLMKKYKPDFDETLLGEGSYVTINNTGFTIIINISPNHPLYNLFDKTTIELDIFYDFEDIQDFFTRHGFNFVDPPIADIEEYHAMFSLLFGRGKVTIVNDKTLNVVVVRDGYQPRIELDDLKNLSSFSIFEAIYDFDPIINIDFVKVQSKLDEMIETYTATIPTGDNNRIELNHDDVFTIR